MLQSAADLLTKNLLLETQRDVYKKLTNDGKRKVNDTEKISVDGEMCNILIAETNKLKGHVSTVTQALGWKENEVKQLKKKIREIEQEIRDLQSSLKQYEIEHHRIENLSREGERMNFQPTELTSKSTLRRFVDELNKECGKLFLLQF